MDFLRVIAKVVNGDSVLLVLPLLLKVLDIGAGWVKNNLGGVIKVDSA